MSNQCVYQFVYQSVQNLQTCKNRMFYFTSRYAKKTVRRSSCRLGIILIGIFIRNILQTTRSLYDFWFKQYGSNSGAQTVVFNVLMTLTLTYVLLVVTESRHEVLASPCEVA